MAIIFFSFIASELKKKESITCDFEDNYLTFEVNPYSKNILVIAQFTEIPESLTLLFNNKTAIFKFGKTTNRFDIKNRELVKSLLKEDVFVQYKDKFYQVVNTSAGTGKKRSPVL